MADPKQPEDPRVALARRQQLPKLIDAVLNVVKEGIAYAMPDVTNIQLVPTSAGPAYVYSSPERPAPQRPQAPRSKVARVQEENKTTPTTVEVLTQAVQEGQEGEGPAEEL